MALKALMLRKKLDEKRSALKALQDAAQALQTREAELEESINEAATDEEKATVEAAVNEHETKVSKNQEEVSALEAEIASLEKDLEETERAQDTAKQKPKADAADPAGTETENRRMTMPVMNRREAIRQSLAHNEVRGFYTQLADAVMKRASLSNTGLLIPEVVMNRIVDRMGDYTTIAREVETISVGGTLRVIVDGADPEAIWVEMSGALTELEGSFAKVELDGWKLGGYMAIPNDVIDDAMINLADYVEKKIAKAIAKSKDKAILKGTGATGKQMVGIIPSLLAANMPAAIDFDAGQVLSKIALVDDGQEAYGEIIAVMKRSTFYGQIVPKMITTDSAGRYIAPDLSKPNIAGLRVVFSQYMDANKILFGDFKRYLLAERSGVKVETSREVKFVEDQTLIKALQRMDGKPVYVDGNGKTKDWVLVTLNAAT